MRFPEPHSSLTMMDVPGCRNVRDLGGLPARNRSRIAGGRLFRGAAPSADADLAGRLGIHRVIDLRSASELGGDAGIQGSRWERFHVPLFQELARWSGPYDRTPRSTASRYLEMLEEGRYPLLRVLELLGSAQLRPTLVHCVAGRDRTGIVIACTLDLLGVPDDAIVRDYAKSRVMDETDGGNADPENCRWLLRLIRETHGSVRDMVRTMGATESILLDLSAALLEPGAG